MIITRKLFGNNEKEKEETKYTSRNIPFNPPTTKATCVCCGNEAEHTVWFAQAY